MALISPPMGARAGSSEREKEKKRRRGRPVPLQREREREREREKERENQPTEEPSRPDTAHPFLSTSRVACVAGEGVKMGVEASTVDARTGVGRTEGSGAKQREEEGEGGNLVDSASSHTLVSKIKPCMSKYKRLIR